MIRRRGSSQITVDVDLDDVLSEMSNEDILAEVEARDLTATAGLGCDRTDAEEAILLLRSGRASDALTYLERSLHPKFRGRAACDEALAKLRASA